MDQRGFNRYINRNDVDKKFNAEFTSSINKSESRTRNENHSTNNNNITSRATNNNVVIDKTQTMKKDFSYSIEAPDVLKRAGMPESFQATYNYKNSPIETIEFEKYCEQQKEKAIKIEEQRKKILAEKREVNKNTSSSRLFRGNQIFMFNLERLRFHINPLTTQDNGKPAAHQLSIEDAGLLFRRKFEKMSLLEEMGEEALSVLKQCHLFASMLVTKNSQGGDHKTLAWLRKYFDYKYIMIH